MTTRTGYRSGTAGVTRCNVGRSNRSFGPLGKRFQDASIIRQLGLRNRACDEENGPGRFSVRMAPCFGWKLACPGHSGCGIGPRPRHSIGDACTFDPSGSFGCVIIEFQRPGETSKAINIRDRGEHPSKQSSQGHATEYEVSVRLFTLPERRQSRLEMQNLDLLAARSCA